MERKLGIAILAAVVTFAILQYGIGTAGFKPTPSLISDKSIDPAALKANATLYATEAAFFVAGMALVFSRVFTPDEEPSSSHSSSTATMQEVADLKKKGLISDEEYKAKRVEILKRM